MRPPFFRLSSVSRVAQIRWRLDLVDSTPATMVVGVGAVARPARPPTAPSSPRPRVTDRESTTSHVDASSSNALAAVWADCIVADSCDDRLMHTTRVGAGVGAPPERRFEGAGRRRRGLRAGRRRPPCAGRSPRRSARCGRRTRRSPKRTVSGTTSMPRAVACVVGEVAGAVGDDADGHRREPSAGARGGRVRRTWAGWRATARRSRRIVRVHHTTRNSGGRAHQDEADAATPPWCGR